CSRNMPWARIRTRSRLWARRASRAASWLPWSWSWSRSSWRRAVVFMRVDFTPAEKNRNRGALGGRRRRLMGRPGAQGIDPQSHHWRNKMNETLTGTVKTWKLSGHTRRFAEVSLPYGKASELFMPVRYNAMTGKGEQRDINPAHLRKLKRAMEAGEYTP